MAFILSNPHGKGPPTFRPVNRGPRLQESYILPAGLQKRPLPKGLATLVKTPQGWYLRKNNV